MEVACPCTVDGVAGDAVVMKFPKGCKMEEVKSDQLVAVSDGRESLAVGGERMSLLTELPTLGELIFGHSLQHCGVLRRGRGGRERAVRCLHYV